MRRRERIAVAAVLLSGGAAAATLGSCKGETFQGGASPAADAAPASDAGPSDAEASDAESEYPFFAGSSVRGAGCDARVLPDGGVCVDFDDGGAATTFFDSLEGAIQPGLDSTRSTSKPSSVVFGATGAATGTAAPIGGDLFGKRGARDAYLAFDYTMPVTTGGYVEVAAIRWIGSSGGEYAVTLISIAGVPMRLEETWTGQDAGSEPMTTVSMERTFVATKFRRVELAVVTSEPGARRAVLRVDGLEAGRLTLSNHLEALGNDTKLHFVLSPYVILDAGTSVSGNYDDCVFLAP